MKKFRIKRVSKLNIAIQELRGDKSPEWRTISYHGNSIYSLISGLYTLIISQHMPENESLLEQLKRLESVLSSGADEIKQLIRKYIK